jgi:pyridoxal 5'-phosphate synthase pdxT subunit
MKVGVLSMQGDVREHLAVPARLGVSAVEVKWPRELDALDGLIVPGGESTTIGMLASEYGFMDAIRARHADGMAVWGTCAGAILLAKRLFPETDQPLLGLMDITVRRNSFGRQVDSFEAALDIPAIGDEPFVAVFIRAPWIESIDADDVEVLAQTESHPVMARQDGLLVSSFHPEMTDDTRIHRYFVEKVCAAT